MSARTAPALVAGLAAAVLVLAGCGSDSSTASDATSSSPSAVAWPDGVPSDIPLSAGSEIQSTSESQGVKYVRFLVPLGFSDAVKYYLAQLPIAGYTLGTGDSEAAEADIPFTMDTDQFSLKLSGLSDPGHTQGVLGVGGDGDDPDADTDAPDTDAPSSP